MSSLSDSASPRRSQEFRPSQVRFAGGNHSPPPSREPSDYGRSPNENRRRHSMASTYSTADITDSYFVDPPPEEPTQDEQERLSDVPVNAGANSTDKRASDMTLTNGASTVTKADRGSLSYAAPPPPRRAASHDSYSRRPSNSRNPSTNLQMARSQSRDVESGRRKQHGGFLSHVKDSFAHFAQDQELPSAPNSRQPSRNISRRNSWASGYEARIEQQGRHLDNFELSQVINADTDDTYLIDENDSEGLRHRKRGQGKTQRDGEEPKIHWHEFDDHGRRKT